MSQSKFVELIQELCLTMDIAQADQVLDGSPVCINNVSFSVIHDPIQSQERLYLYGSLGIDALKDNPEAQRALLGINQDLFLEYGMCLAITPTDNKLIICHGLSMESLTAKDIIEQMKYAASIADSCKELFTETPASFC
ncbi:MAG: CesT family type III secretion system chaperone [Reinekea sp.]